MFRVIGKLILTLLLLAISGVALLISLMVLALLVKLRVSSAFFVAILVAAVFVGAAGIWGVYRTWVGGEALPFKLRLAGRSVDSGRRAVGAPASALGFDLPEYLERTKSGDVIVRSDPLPRAGQ
jgi:hypothetical protein